VTDPHRPGPGSSARQISPDATRCRRQSRRLLRPIISWRDLAIAAAVLLVTLDSTAVGHADPAPPPGPYPSRDLIVRTYNRVNPEDYFIPGDYGVFFLSPTGLNCGIWLKGAFGCTGDLPGTPPGVNRIGWFNGDTSVHYDWTAAIQFPNIQAAEVLPPRSYVEWNDTRCVTIADSSTYCARGNFRFFVTPAGTWLN
jgi:hypothetical protein